MNDKMTKKSHSGRRRRNRERLIYVLTAVFASLCVFAFIFILIAVNNGANDSDADTWIVEGGEVEIAAPPAGGAVIMETEGPLLPTDEPTPEPTSEPTVEPTAEPTAKPTMAVLEGENQRTQITVTAAGDCTLGGDYNTAAHERFDSYAAKYGYDYFLENVRDIFEKDDLTFVNLEGPLTTSERKRGGRIYNFKGDPSYVEILTSSSVEAAGLANNHSLDFSVKGLKETARVLTEAGVGAAGYQNAWKTEIKGVSVTCMSVTEWDYTVDELTQMVAVERAGCDLLLVMIHWGEEKQYSATDSQVEYGHALIDAGADLVLGSHSHVVGGLEMYQGKYIVYGMGNFCFGGNANPSDKDCLIFQQTFSVGSDGALDGGITVIPCASSSQSNANDYRPTPLKGAEATRVLRKIAGYSAIAMSDIKWSAGMDTYLAAVQ